MTSTVMMGSRRTGPAFPHAESKPMAAAASKANVVEVMKLKSAAIRLAPISMVG